MLDEITASVNAVANIWWNVRACTQQYAPRAAPS
jgi:hypothetical protein